MAGACEGIAVISVYDAFHIFGGDFKNEFIVGSGSRDTNGDELAPTDPDVPAIFNDHRFDIPTAPRDQDVVSHAQAISFIGMTGSRHHELCLPRLLANYSL